MYTILCTQHTYGSVVQMVEKDQVKKECERLQKTFSKPFISKQCYTRIEVINNETGEIREYWNNHDNKVNF